MEDDSEDYYLDVSFTLSIVMLAIASCIASCANITIFCGHIGKDGKIGMLCPAFCGILCTIIGAVSVYLCLKEAEDTFAVKENKLARYQNFD